jgi:hypothetical protein
LSRLKNGWQSSTLAEKIPENILRQDPSLLQTTLAKEAEGLAVEWESSLIHRWLTINARGDDAEAFSNLLRKKMGEAPVEIRRIEKWDNLRGYVTGAGGVGFGVYVDIGVLEPRPKDALYPLHRLRAQLSDGTQESVKKVLADNALLDYFPVKTVVTGIEGDKITVELADETLDMFLSWRKYPLDRLVAVGLSTDQAQKVVRQMKLTTDIIEICPLSLFVQSFVLKIGTDAPGIIAKVGGRLRGVHLASYRARKAVD